LAATPPTNVLDDLKCISQRAVILAPLLVKHLLVVVHVHHHSVRCRNAHSEQLVALVAAICHKPSLLVCYLPLRSLAHWYGALLQ
jgi:hypothetical protein